MSYPYLPDPVDEPDPQLLTPEYYKARKQLLLWSGILLTWQIIGVDLDAVRQTGGYVGPFVAAIKRPKDIPIALFCVVLYLLFRTTVEFLQSGRRSREQGMALLDFIVAWVVSLGALSTAAAVRFS